MRGPIAIVIAACVIAATPSRALSDGHGEPHAPVVFAVAGSAIGEGDRRAILPLRAIEGTPAAFIVHFDTSTGSRESCDLASLVRLRDALDTSAKPVVPVVAASQWSDCDGATTDADERLARVGDTFYATDESLGRARLHWVRQSAVPRFHRYRANLRWQIGNVLFVVLNVPDNNNNFRIAAGRNGEFEERSMANNVWLDRSFRLATERRLSAIVLFVDAAPRFGLPLRPPDSHSRERDGHYEWKLALRDLVAKFRGHVLLVQGRLIPEGRKPADLDQPLRDTAGKPLPNFTRVALDDRSTEARWMRVEVDPKDAKVFSVTRVPLFDDPSGELYGPSRLK